MTLPPARYPQLLRGAEGAAPHHVNSSSRPCCTLAAPSLLAPSFMACPLAPAPAPARRPPNDGRRAPAPVVGRAAGARGMPSMSSHPSPSSSCQPPPAAAAAAGAAAAAAARVGDVGAEDRALPLPPPWWWRGRVAPPLSVTLVSRLRASISVLHGHGIQIQSMELQGR